MTSTPDPHRPVTDPPDSDAVAQWIYATGAADTFLARELAHGVLHFHQADGNDDVFTEVAVRVVRELGHPRVALALETRPFDAFDHEPSAEGVVYPSNLIAAQRLGLLRLDGAGHVDHLVAGLIEPPRPGQELDWLDGMSRVGERFHEAVILPDVGPAGDGALRAVTALRLGQRLAGRPLVINLPGPQPAADGLQTPSLFPDDDGDTERALALLEHWPATAGDVRWRWHIAADRPFLVDDASRLRAVCQAALRLKHWQFVIDSPGRLPDLGFGVTTAEPAVLQVVHADVAALRRHVASEVGEPEQLLPKVASLARLALAVGHAKRRHLRRCGPPGVRGAFLVERAQLALSLHGVEDVVGEFAPGGDDRRRAAVARQLRRAFTEALADDPAGERWSLDRVGDNPPDTVAVDRPTVTGVDQLADRLRAALRCV